MSLNVSAEQSVSGDPEDPSSGQPTAHPRSKIADDLLDELSAWNPREWIAAFSRWHHGAVSLIHLNVVAAIEADGPMSMSRLAEALNVSVASTTGIVTRMEKRGLVVRRHGEDDRRVVLVHLTRTGQTLFRKIDERRRAKLTRLLESLTVDEQAAFLLGLRAMHRARAELAESSGDERADSPRAAREEAR